LPLKARPVQRFVEKPDAATAAAYLAEGGYFWNGGIFVLRASTWLQALQRFRPDILSATRTAFEARSTDALFVRPDQAAFEAVRILGLEKKTRFYQASTSELYGLAQEIRLH
jgi:mannose-1-phosphate guanylyltransferase/mannose-6-phosphate isomerase